MTKKENKNSGGKQGSKVQERAKARKQDTGSRGGGFLTWERLTHSYLPRIKMVRRARPQQKLRKERLRKKAGTGLQWTEGKGLALQPESERERKVSRLDLILREVKLPALRSQGLTQINACSITAYQGAVEGVLSAQNLSFLFCHCYLHNNYSQKAVLPKMLLLREYFLCFPTKCLHIH